MLQRNFLSARKCTRVVLLLPSSEDVIFSEEALVRLHELAPDISPEFYLERTIESRSHPALLQVVDELGLNKILASGCLTVDHFPDLAAQTAQIELCYYHEKLSWDIQPILNEKLEKVDVNEASHDELKDLVNWLKEAVTYIDDQL